MQEKILKKVLPSVSTLGRKVTLTEKCITNLEEAFIADIICFKSTWTNQTFVGNYFTLSSLYSGRRDTKILTSYTYLYSWKYLKFIGHQEKSGCGWTWLVVGRPWRVPATRPDPNFFFATRTRPELFLKISEFRVFLSKLFPRRLLQIFEQQSSNSVVF